MILLLEFGDAFCFCKTFVINGTPACPEDFGDQGDQSPDSAQPYGCGDMRFIRKAPADATLAKYKVSSSEYSEICDKLEEGLSFGACGWCV